MLCSWAKPNTAGSVVSPKTSPTSPHLTPLVHAHPLLTPAGKKAAASGGQPATLEEAAARPLALRLAIISPSLYYTSPTKTIYKQIVVSCLFFFFLVKQSTKSAFAYIHTRPGAGIFLYFRNLCLLLKPS